MSRPTTKSATPTWLTNVLSQSRNQQDNLSEFQLSSGIAMKISPHSQAKVQSSDQYHVNVQLTLGKSGGCLEIRQLPEIDLKGAFIKFDIPLQLVQVCPVSTEEKEAKTHIRLRLNRAVQPQVVPGTAFKALPADSLLDINIDSSEPEDTAAIDFINTLRGRIEHSHKMDAKDKLGESVPGNVHVQPIHNKAIERQSLDEVHQYIQEFWKDKAGATTYKLGYEAEGMRYQSSTRDKVLRFKNRPRPSERAIKIYERTANAGQPSPGERASTCTEQNSRQAVTKSSTRVPQQTVNRLLIKDNTASLPQLAKQSSKAGASSCGSMSSFESLFEGESEGRPQQLARGGALFQPIHTDIIQSLMAWRNSGADAWI